MALFRTARPEELDAMVRSLNLRADQLDREGKHVRAAVERDKAAKLESKAASQRTAVV